MGKPVLRRRATPFTIQKAEKSAGEFLDPDSERDVCEYSDA